MVSNLHTSSLFHPHDYTSSKYHIPTPTQTLATNRHQSNSLSEITAVPLRTKTNHPRHQSAHPHEPRNALQKPHSRWIPSTIARAIRFAPQYVPCTIHTHTYLPTYLSTYIHTYIHTRTHLHGTYSTVQSSTVAN